MSSKEKEKRDFPRNISQIGEPGKEKRSYLEDYAVAYLREVKGAVLFGELVRIKGARCYFISGAVEVPEGDFSEENWNYVTEEAGKSFAKIKTNKILNDMAKVQIKSEKLTPFGGIFSIME